MATLFPVSSDNPGRTKALIKYITSSKTTVKSKGLFPFKVRWGLSMVFGTTIMNQRKIFSEGDHFNAMVEIDSIGQKGMK